MGRIGMCLFNDIPQTLGVVDHHAGHLMILVPGLTGPYFLEKVGIQSIPQVSFTFIDIHYIIHGKVGKDTGLNVTVTIDVKITRICSPACQTSIYIRAIIPPSVAGSA
jgi:hypothetical protein